VRMWRVSPETERDKKEKEGKRSERVGGLDVWVVSSFSFLFSSSSSSLVDVELS
jgi:hypothetical protein